jgi:hypothetical protein
MIAGEEEFPFPNADYVSKLLGDDYACKGCQSTHSGETIRFPAAVSEDVSQHRMGRTFNHPFSVEAPG